MRRQELQHRFVEFVPETLEPGVLYVSLPYATVVHLCCCGCRAEVVTPLTPTDWRITFDGETISLDPSVGSWNLNCRSHYIIRRNVALPCENWSDAAVKAEQGRDRAAKARFYGTEPGPSAPSLAVPPTPSPKRRGWLSKTWNWITGRQSSR